MRSGKPIAQYDVVVRPSRYGAGEAEAAIARVLPGASVHVETLQNGLSVTGQGEDARRRRSRDADRARLSAHRTDRDNRLSVASPACR